MSISHEFDPGPRIGDEDAPKRHPSHIWTEPNGLFWPHSSGAKCAACGASYCRGCPVAQYPDAFEPCSAASTEELIARGFLPKPEQPTDEQRDV